MSEYKGILKGRISALITKHEKERVIKPAFETATGCHVVVESTYDTDKFGTFTGDIARRDSQLETARRKARCGMEILGLDMGLSSEGSFGPHPFISFVPWNIEVVMLLDDRENIELYGEWAGSDTNFANETVATMRAAEEFARKIGFPQHHVVARPVGGQPQDIIKGIADDDALRNAFERGMGNSPVRKVLLEADLRAHANPTRMKNILKATQNLIDKINSLCSACGAYGFWITDREQGLPCEWCNMPTGEIMTEISVCARCGNREERWYPKGKKAPAGRCSDCNP